MCLFTVLWLVSTLTRKILSESNPWIYYKIIANNTVLSIFYIKKNLILLFNLYLFQYLKGLSLPLWRKEINLLQSGKQIILFHRIPFILNHSNLVSLSLSWILFTLWQVAKRRPFVAEQQSIYKFLCPTLRHFKWQWVK